MQPPALSDRTAEPLSTPTGAACGTALAATDRAAWPKHRILFLLAGTFTLVGTALAAGVSRWFALLPAAVGANQLLLVATGWCPASALIDRLRPPAASTGSA